MRFITQQFFAASGDLEDHDLFANAVVIRVGEARQKIGIVVDDPGAAPNLDPPPVRVIHEEEDGLVVFFQVAGADVLPVAAEIGEGQGLVVENL